MKAAVRFDEGKSYQAIIDIDIESGDALFLMFSPDNWGNSSVFTQQIQNGPQTINIKPSRLGMFRPIIRVESGKKAAFDVRFFEFKELPPNPSAVDIRPKG